MFKGGRGLVGASLEAPAGDVKTNGGSRQHRKRPSLPTIQLPVFSNSYVFTSSKYQAVAKDTVSPFRPDRPTLTEDQLRRHGEHATNSSSLDVVLPGFVPLRVGHRRRDSPNIFPFIPLALHRSSEGKVPSRNAASTSSSDDSQETLRIFSTPNSSSESSSSSTGLTSPNEGAANKAALSFTELIRGMNDQGKGKPIPHPAYNSRGRREDPFMAPGSPSNKSEGSASP